MLNAQTVSKGAGSMVSVPALRPHHTGQQHWPMATGRWQQQRLDSLTDVRVPQRQRVVDAVSQEAHCGRSAGQE